MNHYTPEHCAEVVANWVKKRITTILYHNVRKVYTGRGEFYTKADWALYGSDGRWHNIDAVALVKSLGGNYDPREHLLGKVLADLGYRVHDEGGALAIIGERD